MDEEVLAGRNLVIGVIATSLIVSITNTLILSRLSEENDLGVDLVRFVLTILLGVALYQGRGWARWFSVFSFMLGGVGGLIAGVFFLPTVPIAVPLFFFMGIAYTACGIVLWWLPSVAAYFAFRREQRRRGA
jgi:hypothetical protein